MNATQNSNITTLTFGQEVKVAGRRGWYSVFTYEGSCRKYGDDPVAARKRDADRGYPTDDLIQPAATVIVARGRFHNPDAPVLKHGEEVVVDGRRAVLDGNAGGDRLVIRYV